MGGTKLLGAITKKLVPKVGKKLAQELATGTLKGISSSAVEGFGRGLMEDENPLATAAQDALVGAAFGGAIGAGTGAIAQNARKKAVNELKDKRNDWGIAFTKQTGKPDEAIEKLLKEQQGFVPKAIKKKGIGDIDFVWGKGGKRGYGISHIIDQRNKDGLDSIQFSKKVPNIITRGNVEKNTKQPNIDFIRFGDDSALVKKVWDDKKRNWIVTAFKDNEALNKSINRTPDIVNNQNEMTPSFNLNKDNSIIQNSNLNLNPQATNQTLQPPKSHNQWLEDLKRKRKKRWF